MAQFVISFFLQKFQENKGETFIVEVESKIRKVNRKVR